MAMVIYRDSEPSTHYYEENQSGVTSNGVKIYSGLRNQGATCYLNSVIQTLFMTPEFRSAIFSWRYDKDKDGPEDTCIPLQLQKLFGYLQLSCKKSADTVGLTTSFGWTGRDVFQQQDAQELFRVLFDALEDSFKDTPLKNVIDQLYAGEMIDYVRCIDVNYESERSDKFLDLSFAIIPFGKTKALSSLNQCIKMYLRPELLDGTNQYYAESVGRKVDAIKGIKVRRLPHVMAIQLKRFVFDFSGDNIVQKKINDVVKFPMVLDMNAYVSKKRRTQSLVASDDDPGVSTDDFEEFLQEQMELLREKSIQSKDNNDQVNPVEDDDMDVMENIPDLVDQVGKKSPDQVLEETKLNQLQQIEYNGSTSRDELLNLVESRGEWVYELFAVLIHSGAITGGHYYAYIKDLSSSIWYNFNDSNVTQISEKEVQEAWGKPLVNYSGSYYSNYNWYESNSYAGSYGKPVSGDNAVRSPTAYSGANAYMLMYRKVTKEAIDVTGVISTFPSDDMIPDYIREAVLQENEKALARQREEEERKLQVTLTIYWKNELNYLVVKSTDTLKTLFSQLWKRCLLMHQPEFEDILNSARSKNPDGSLENDIDIPCPYNRIRLRYLVVSSGLMYESYEIANESDNKTISDVGLVSYRNYLIEIRREDEEFDEFIPGGISLLIHVFQPKQNAYSEALQLSFKQASSILDLKMAIVKICTKKKLLNYPVEKVRLMKAQKNYNMKPPSIDILENNLLSLHECHIGYQDKLYVDEYKPPPPYGYGFASQPHISEPTITYESEFDSPGYQVLYASLFELRVYYNIPLKNHPQYDNNNCTTLLVADSRWTIPKLREVITELLVKAQNEIVNQDPTYVPILIETSRVRMFQQQIEGREYRSDSDLRQENIYEGSRIAISFGLVPPLNHYVLKFSLYLPKCRDMISLRDQTVYNIGPPTDCEDTISESISNPEQSTSIVDAFAEKLNLHHKSKHSPSDGYEGSDEEAKSDWNTDNDSAGVRRIASSKIKKPNQTFTGVKEHSSSSVRPVVQNLDSKTLSTTKVEEKSNSSEEIQPSDFAAIVISNELDKSELIPVPIEDLFGNDDTLVDNIREQLAAKLTPLLPTLVSSDTLEALGLPVTDGMPTTIASNRLRIRESNESCPGRIIHNGESFRKQGVYITSSRPWVVQVLSEQEANYESSLSAIHENIDVQITVVKWQRKTWSLTEKYEFVIRGDTTIQHVCRYLASVFDIPNYENLKILPIKAYSKILLSDLNEPGNRGVFRNWANYTFDTRKMKDLTYGDFKFRHGDILLIQDSLEPLKELTKEDLLSLQYVEEASRVPYTGSYGYDGGRYDSMLNYNKHNQPNSIYDSPPRSDIGSSYSGDSKLSLKLTKTGPTSPAAVGIKIITQKDRLRQAAEQTNQIEQSEQSSSNKTLDETGAVSNDKNIANAFSTVDSYSVLNSDENEFEKQGGIALFSDLA